MLNPLIFESSQGSDLSNLSLSRFPQLSLYPPITPIAILYFLPSPCGSSMNNSCLSRLPQLSIYPPSASLGEILTLSVLSPILFDLLTYLSLSLSALRPSRNLNLVN